MIKCNAELFQELHTLSSSDVHQRNSEKTPIERDVMQRNLPENPISALLHVNKTQEFSGHGASDPKPSKLANSNLGFVEQVENLTPIFRDVHVHVRYVYIGVFSPSQMLLTPSHLLPSASILLQPFLNSLLPKRNQQPA